MSSAYSGSTVFLNYFSDPALTYRETFSDHCILWSTFGAAAFADAGLGSTSTLRCANLKPGDVIISSVLANAAGSDEIPNECFTLLNTSTVPIDLRGLTISDEQACWTVPESMVDAVIDPGTTWIVYGRTYNPTSDTGAIALRNSGETLALTCGSVVLDVWNYPGESKDGVPIQR
jgi:hypothetical protein